MEIDPQRVLSFTLPIVLAITARIIRGWKTRQEYALRWVTLAPTPVPASPGDAPGPADMTSGGEPVANLTRFYFIVHNSGANPLDAASIVEPLTWTAPGKVLDANVVETRPAVKLELEPSADSLKITWRLFNQDCKALIEAVCDCGSNAGRGSIDGQIRNVSEIKSMESSYVDKEEVRQAVREKLAQAPRFLQRLQSEGLNVYLKLHSKDMLFAAGVFCCVLVAAIWGTVWLGLGAAVLIVLVWLLRDPDYALLRRLSVHRARPRPE